MQDKAIIIFIKNPEAGKVKTRLADDIGTEKALMIYERLLAHTRNITQGINADKYLYYADYINDNDDWDNTLYHKRVQKGDDLGERMLHAFHEVFSYGHQHVIIIGSDCLEITQDIIESALNHLAQNDVVIGPSLDGGYYALGKKELIPEIFQNKTWSTDTVYNDTIKDIATAGLKYRNLPILTDIDTIKDVPGDWL